MTQVVARGQSLETTTSVAQLRRPSKRLVELLVL
jgi:hypothetical protein